MKGKFDEIPTGAKKIDTKVKARFINRLLIYQLQNQARPVDC